VHAWLFVGLLGRGCLVQPCEGCPDYGDRQTVCRMRLFTAPCFGESRLSWCSKVEVCNVDSFVDVSKLRGVLHNSSAYRPMTVLISHSISHRRRILTELLQATWPAKPRMYIIAWQNLAATIPCQLKRSCFNYRAAKAALGAEEAQSEMTAKTRGATRYDVTILAAK
jgi:hypothetical protein